MKHHELLWGAALLAFIAWVLLAPNPSMRINRVCRPIAWAGSGVVSLTALTAPKYESDAQEGGNRVVYGCEYSIWRLFYQKDYDKYLAGQRRRLLGAKAPRHSLPKCDKPASNGSGGPGGSPRSCAHSHALVSRAALGSAK
jgi:hypothetical protein